MTLEALRYKIKIFTRLKMCHATATPQLQVGDNYSYLFNKKLSIFPTNSYLIG